MHALGVVVFLRTSNYASALVQRQDFSVACIEKCFHSNATIKINWSIDV